ncbi:MAG TPA: FHA domain-containing protein [Candidatus Xenobia bacterium]|jgi:tetratricopeptide (TPR) repeat protein
MERDDILGTLKDGVNLAGKVAVRGVGEAVKAVKSASPSKGPLGETGLYFQRHLAPRFGQFLPALEFQELQSEPKLIIGLLKNITVPAAERIFVQGCQSLLQGAVGEARDKFHEAVLKDTQFTDAYFLAGCLSLSLGEWGRAADAFQKALLCQSGLGGRIRKYLPSLRMTLCLTDNTSLIFYPDIIGLNMLSVFALRSQGRMAEGIRTLEQLQGIMPNHPLILFMLACLHYEAAQYGKVMEKTLGLSPDTSLAVAALLVQAKASLALHDPQSFADMFRKLLTRSDIDPQLLWDVRALLQQSYHMAGLASEAEREAGWLAIRAPGHQDFAARLGLVAGSVVVTALPEPVAVVATPPPASKPVVVAVRQEDQQDVEEAPLPTANPWEGRLESEDGKITFPLTAQGCTIGREEGDIQLPWDTSVSMHHARIVWDQNAYWVEDTGSTNGTWVNGHRLGRRVDLNRGDVVTVGGTRIKVV